MTAVPCPRGRGRHRSRQDGAAAGGADLTCRGAATRLASAMTTLVSGRVVDDETGEGVPDVLVEALGDWTLTSRRLALTQTGNAGGFALAVKGPVDTPSHPAIVRLRVQDVAGRALADDRDVTVLGA